MTNFELHFRDPESAAAFLASVCTCFTCPVKASELGACAGICREGTCEGVILEWLNEGGADD